MIPEEKKSILNSIFENQDLPQEDRDFWFEQLNALGDKGEKIQEILIDWMESNQEDIPWLTKIQKQKVEAMRSRDADEWEKILEEEENYLNNKS